MDWSAKSSGFHAHNAVDGEPVLEAPQQWFDEFDEHVTVTTGGLQTFKAIDLLASEDIPDVPTLMTPAVMPPPETPDARTAPSTPVQFATMDGRFGTVTNAVVRPADPQPLRLDAFTCRILLEMLGPSLGLWRAAEIAVLQEVAARSIQPILDVGCGDGFVTSQVLSLVDVGLDPDEYTLQRAARLGLYEQFECAPIEEISCADESFSTIISNSVLEHLPTIDAALAAMARVLRPGGRLIFTTPTEDFSTWLALPTKRYARWRNRQLCHLNLWSTAEWTRHLEQAGFEVELVRPYLRQRLVTRWDQLELLQQIWIGRHRLFSLFWRHLPSFALDALARKLAHTDLSAHEHGGGRLIVAKKR